MDRSEAKRAFKQAKRPMGVYRIRVGQDSISYLGSSSDLRAILNRHRTELKFGSHRNKELAEKWRTLGEPAFVFEILDELEPDEKSESKPADDLEVLMEIWIDKLEAEGGSVVRL